MSDNPIRVVVCDDSSTVRRIIRRVLRDAPDIEVVGEATDGVEVLPLLAELKPDLLTLDIEMPQQDGLTTLGQIKRAGFHIPVIMISTLTQRGAAITLEALHRGASDYVGKPSQVGSLSEALDRMRVQIVPKIRALTARKSASPAPKPRSRAPEPAPRPPATADFTPAVGRAPVSKKPLAAMTPMPQWRPSLSSKGADKRPKIKAPQLHTPAPTRRATPPQPEAKPRAKRRRGAPPRVVCVAVSTGGPNAITQVFSSLPKDFPLPILVVQHMPSPFTNLLAERLHDRCPLSVHEAYAGAPVEPGTIWIAPGGFHMVPQKTEHGVKLAINEDPPENSCRPAADPMFRAAVEIYGSQVLGVVMTGMGHDGLDGCRHIKSAGGDVIIQDESSSVVWGMPGAVHQASLHDGVFSIDQLAREICARAGLSRGGGVQLKHA